MEFADGGVVEREREGAGRGFFAITHVVWVLVWVLSLFLKVTGRRTSLVLEE